MNRINAKDKFVNDDQMETQFSANQLTTMGGI
jgi:hypothetical protein